MAHELARSYAEMFASMFCRVNRPTPPSTLFPIQCFSVTPIIGTVGSGPFCAPRTEWRACWPRT